MASACIRGIFVLMLLILATAVGSAQGDLRAQLFGEADKAMKAAREKRADLFAPKNFTRGMDQYRSADEDFKKGSGLDKIQEKLVEAVSAFNKSIEAARLGEMTFTDATAARNDAINVDAPKLYPETWRKAEELFRSAAGELEDGSLSGARNDAGEAQGLYRTTELDAITTTMLGPARDLLKKADAMDVKQNAPKTLQKAHDLAVQCEASLKQNRYNNAVARNLANESAYEASHAIYLNQMIAQYKKKDMTFEDVLTASEEPYSQLAATLNVTARFDSGFGPATRQILATIQTPDTAKERMVVTIRRQDAELNTLRTRVASMEKTPPPPSAATPPKKTLR